MIEVGGIILGLIIMLFGMRITRREERERWIASERRMAMRNGVKWD